MAVALGLKWDIAFQVGQGMAYLHAQKVPVLHRDLKSANILVTAGFGAKITDFGESREINDEENMTETGTPYFMAPETMVGEYGGEYSSAIDVYSFGVLLLEMYCNGAVKKAFNALSSLVVMSRVQKVRQGGEGARGEGRRLCPKGAAQIACPHLPCAPPSRLL